MRILGPLLFAAAVVPVSLPAQPENGLRLGLAASAPGRVLNAGPGTVRLGLGVAVEGAWVQRFSGDVDIAYQARIGTAAVRGEQAGASWEPGRALMLDVAIRFERAVGERFTLLAGPGLSHWSGPDDTAPFAGAGSALLGGEAGLAWRPGAGSWRATITSRVTRIGPDPDREVTSGFVFRWLAGVQRAL